MIQGIIKALFLLFLISYTFEENAVNDDGNPASLWVTGCILYSSVVILCNMQLMFQSHLHMIWSLFIQTLSILSFFFIYYIENLFPRISELYGTFYYLWTTPQFYFLTTFVIIAIFLVQKIKQQIFMVRKKIQENKGKRRASLSDFLTKKKSQVIPQFILNKDLISQNHGYAFSQQKGSVPQIMESLQRQIVRYSTLQRISKG